ncbi:MAG TPA: YtxH domain-containing protein [Bryobacteraceae bacterium]|nr:YtxH domain-containing protein [Bryobacteraceae bacterium]
MNRATFFLLGIAAGAVAGLLYAPQAGWRTRAKVAAKSKQGRRFLAEQSCELRDNVSETFGRGRIAVSKSIRGFMG